MPSPDNLPGDEEHVVHQAGGGGPGLRGGHLQRFVHALFQEVPAEFIKNLHLQLSTLC